MHFKSCGIYSSVSNFSEYSQNLVLGWSTSIELIQHTCITTCTLQWLIIRLYIMKLWSQPVSQAGYTLWPCTQSGLSNDLFTTIRLKGLSSGSDKLANTKLHAQKECNLLHVCVRVFGISSITGRQFSSIIYIPTHTHFLEAWISDGSTCI